MSDYPKPERVHFSSGPCSKHPDWSLECLQGAILGRSHRVPLALARIQALLDGTRRCLRVPDDYRIALVPGSDTGAVEMALWTLLGARAVTVLAWEKFGRDWLLDMTLQLAEGCPSVRAVEAPYGTLPDLDRVDFSHDVIFTWNGTTSGACVPDGDWIAAERKGLTIADATSAAFGVDLPFDLLDVVTFSWQKLLGGEAAHGILILSPRAVERLKSHRPSWPIPKLFRLVDEEGEVDEALFSGHTINTPSMLCVEDCLSALHHFEAQGGLPSMIARVQENYACLEAWLSAHAFLENVVADPRHRSRTGVCFRLKPAWRGDLAPQTLRALYGRVASSLERDGIAYDILGHGEVPPGFRLWCGPTVLTRDLAALLPWFDDALAAEMAAMTGEKKEA